ncbi:MAG: NADH-quinone oxidoreductase subunit K [Candidatus Omnitrophica bacterium]|nr:NADH-quinone oxidoreductase subunit K [Candidatus Omnitrophota bacterium]
MTIEPLMIFWPFCLFIIILAIIGFYCIFATYNLIRVLIGLELLIKAVTLLLVVVGFVSGHTALIQAFIITLIVVEVVVIVVATGVIINLRRHNQSLDTRKLRNLRG